MAERSGVVSLHLGSGISPDSSKMTMYYKITECSNKTQFYGLALAKLVEFPLAVLETAHSVSEELDRLSQGHEAMDNGNDVDMGEEGSEHSSEEHYF
ncbi:hypothetical protein BDW68DRAFT_159656 [Aspergillus falconensis]